MRTFLVNVEIRAKDEAEAEKVRDEIIGGIEDGRERGEFEADVSTDGIVEVDTERSQKIIELVRDRHCLRSDDELEIDDEAIVSEVEDGAFVAGWMFIPKLELIEAGLLPDPDAESEEGESGAAESEGDTCD